MKKIKKGDRVILTGSGLIHSNSWPVWGSEYSCVGTVIDIRRCSVHILWDNGAKKLVVPTMLSLCDGREEDLSSPNIAFMLHKRKINEKDKKRR